MRDVNKIKQYFPNFVEMGDLKAPIVEFKTVKELLEIPWVKRFGKDLDSDMVFYRWSLAEHSLMAEYNKGHYYLVIGTIYWPETVSLPEWSPVK